MTNHFDPVELLGDEYAHFAEQFDSTVLAQLREKDFYLDLAGPNYQLLNQYANRGRVDQSCDDSALVAAANYTWTHLVALTEVVETRLALEPPDGCWTVVDVGCGPATGWHAVDIACRRSAECPIDRLNYVGIERSPKMREFAVQMSDQQSVVLDAINVGEIAKSHFEADASCLLVILSYVLNQDDFQPQEVGSQLCEMTEAVKADVTRVLVVDADIPSTPSALEALLEGMSECSPRLKNSWSPETGPSHYYPVYGIDAQRLVRVAKQQRLAYWISVES